MLSIPQRILGEALIRSEVKYPLKTAIIADGKEYTYSDLTKASLRIAGHLISSGLLKGDRVAIYMNNSWQSAASIYGITLAGGVFLVINPQTKTDKLNFILNDSGASIVISEIHLKDTLLQALKNALSVQEVILSGDNSKLSNENKPIRIFIFDLILNEDTADSNLPAIIPSDLAALIYTSGSTGFPKGVIMTHLSMVFTCWSLIEYLRLTEDERIILLLPLAFDYGLYQLLLSVTIGGTLIIEQSFSFPETIFEDMRKLTPTIFPGVPTIFALMIESYKKTGLSFDFVRKITNTAATLPSEFIPYLKKIFPDALIFKMYGLTECKRVCYLEPELIDEKPESVGKAIPGTEVLILNKEGNPVNIGESGILYIRGPHLMAGYWNQKELTNEMLKPGKFPGEKMLCSHDLFRMDKDGFLYFLGRTDEIIKTRGEKVSPVEIENIIYKIKGIKEVGVIGYPDRILGESVIAFVSMLNEVMFKEDGIRKFCMANLELFMVPNRVFLLEQIPKNPNNKIDKKKLKEIASLLL